MCDQLVTGIQNLMFHMGIWTEAADTSSLKESIVSQGPDAVAFLNATVSGVFITELHNDVVVTKGETVGQIISPLTGDVLSNVVAPCNGLLFTIRAYPMVYEGSLLGRIHRL